MNNKYSDSFIKKILEDSNSIAIVGASPNEERDSHKVMKYLLEKGYKIYPVNPKESGNMILGQYCFDDLESINKPVDMVDVFRATEAVMGIAEQSISIRAKVLWTQENIIHEEAAKLAENAGLKVVMDRCPKKELSKSYWTTKTK
ncbi:CoA-binding protein [Gammaproteobacteria bacterium]|jgi:predicted CoA-binding protein|nr:CoA-binding protein [Gammaproteobacteria bacterium]